MIHDETLALVREILNLFSDTNGLPIEFYEIAMKKEVVCTIEGRDESFPEYCRFVWSLDSGRGRSVCEADMCHRAQSGLEADGRRTVRCHAGLTNAIEPIVAKGRPLAVLQYGATVLENDPKDPASMAAARRETLRALRPTPEQLAALDKLYQQIPRRSVSEWNHLREKLTPIIATVVEKYVTQRTRDRRSLEQAYHDLQLRLAAALHTMEYFTSQNAFDKKTQQHLGEIRGTLDAIHRIAQNMTRGEYLPSQFEYRLHDLRLMLTKAQAICRAESLSRGLEFVTEFPQDGACLVQASGPHLEHALNNLVQNAVKYSYRTSSLSKSRFVSIRVKRRHVGQDTWYDITISNYGVGIDDDEYEAIFTEQYRGRMATEEYRVGTGRGLSLTKRFINRHGGTITVNSEPAPGGAGVDWPYLTRFTVALPARGVPIEPKGVKHEDAGLDRR